MAGVATADITPEPGLMLWGYSNRTHGSDRHARPVDGQGRRAALGRQSVAIVSLDLGRTPEDSVLDKIREQTKAGCGVSNLFITASHTHHAPVMESTADSPNPYAEKVGDKIAEIICRRRKHRARAHWRRHAARPILPTIGASILPDGRVAMQWRNAERETTEPVDREYAMIRLDRADGSALAVLFNYACHPVVMGGDNYQYSADYVGTACAVVEEELKTKCLFLQGGCGNINPYMDKTPLDQGGVEEMRKMGTRSESCS